MIISSPNRPNYPTQFLDLEDKPDQLYLSRPCDLVYARCLAVVGARKMAPWVSEWLEYEYFRLLQSFDISVISGGARGVDQVAHSLALRAGRATCVVLPSGLNKIYPKSLTGLANQANVTLLSEYEPDQEVRKHHFYYRNRLIAALSPILFVVQAEKKSGTMITAKYAIEMGRRVVCLPGPPLDPRFSGNNQLIYDGASLIRDHKDLEAIVYQELQV